MSIDFAMPQLGYDMTEAKIAHWTKNEGERVEPGEPLAEIATDKVNLELVDHPGGVIEKLLVPEGETVAVGTPIVRFGGDGAGGDGSQKAGTEASAAPAERKAPAQRERAEERPAPAPESSQEASAAADRANGVAEREQVSQSPGETPSAAPAPPESAAGPQEQQAPSDHAAPAQQKPEQPSDAERKPSEPPPMEQKPGRPAAAEDRQEQSPGVEQRGGPGQPAPDQARPGTANGAARLRVSPLARKIADQKGVDLSRVEGSGPEGRILKDDVEEYAETHAVPRPAPAPGEPTPHTSAPSTTSAGARELSPMRQAIARRMQESKQQIPHFYVATDVRMDAVLTLRDELSKAAGEELKITINDFIVKATAAALQQRPSFNAWFVDGKIRIHDRINLGLAVALEDGLIVPALLDCQNRSLGQISAGAADLVQRARKGSLKPEEFTGGTFSISNLGMFGVSEFQAILYPPQVGILAIGAAQKQPVVEADRLVVGTMMKVYLSCDHRATDGAAAAKFLADLKRILENPMLMIL